MRLRILSDLHLEFSEWTPPKVECDAVILAGDIHMGPSALPWIEKHFAGQTVIYIQGNHEGYRHDVAEVHRQLEAYAKFTPPIVDLRYLNNEWTELYEKDDEGLSPVFVFGGTLWTDFELDGNPEMAKRIAHQCMNDYRLVSNEGQRITPAWTVERHKEGVEEIVEGLRTECLGDKSVVVTHHLPSRMSIDNDYRASEVNPAYASDLEHIMKAEWAPSLWVHGHTHRSKDYICGNTRVVANPRGYSQDPRGFENMSFKGDLVVEV